VRKLTANGDVGFNSVTWDVKVDVFDKRKRATGERVYAGKGKYKMKFINGTDSSEIEVEIK